MKLIHWRCYTLMWCSASPVKVSVYIVLNHGNEENRNPLLVRSISLFHVPYFSMIHLDALLSLSFSSDAWTAFRQGRRAGFLESFASGNLIFLGLPHSPLSGAIGSALMDWAARNCDSISIFWIWRHQNLWSPDNTSELVSGTRYSETGPSSVGEEFWFLLVEIAVLDSLSQRHIYCPLQDIYWNCQPDNVLSRGTFFGSFLKSSLVWSHIWECLPRLALVFVLNVQITSSTLVRVVSSLETPRRSSPGTASMVACGYYHTWLTEEKQRQMAPSILGSSKGAKERRNREGREFEKW